MRQRLNVQYRNAVEEFARRVVCALGNQIDSVVLYGSAARGEAKRSSDVDLLLISPDPTAVKDKISTLRSNFVYERNFSLFISLAHLSRDEFLDLLKIGSPFANDVLTEGVVLHDNGTFSRLRQRAVSASG